MNKENQFDIHRYNEIEIPKELDDAVKKGLVKGNQLWKKEKKKKNAAKWISVAAAAACMIIVSSPVLAAKIPLIGHVFEKLQGDYSYKGNYGAVATPLQEDSSLETGNGNLNASAYTKESSGVTVSLSEVYCNDQAIYIAMTFENEEGFPKSLEDDNGSVSMQIKTLEKYSFNEEEQNAFHLVEGKMIDDNTFAGILRINLDDVNLDDSEYVKAIEQIGDVETDEQAQALDLLDYDSLVKKIEVPENFTMNLSISQIIGTKADPIEIDYGKTEKELEEMSDEEWSQLMEEVVPEDYYDFPSQYSEFWYDGSWDYEIQLAMDKSKTQVINVNTTNEDGVGITTIEKTPFEIKINESYPYNISYDYFLVVLDANGEILPYGSDANVNIYAIQDRDISTVYVYICDYDEYMDEIKGYYYSEDYEQKKIEKSYKQLLDERAVYSAEVTIENESK